MKTKSKSTKTRLASSPEFSATFLVGGLAAVAGRGTRRGAGGR
jgi:hypothetical protein